MAASVELVVVDEVAGEARSAQLRGAWYSSSGKTLMANGIVMGLASKKSALFSQYRRAEDTPVLVSQYMVMLSRMSSRVRSLSKVPCRARCTSPGWPVPSPWSSMNAARSAGESASPYSVCGRVVMICA